MKNVYTCSFAGLLLVATSGLLHAQFNWRCDKTNVVISCPNDTCVADWFGGPYPQCKYTNPVSGVVTYLNFTNHDNPLGGWSLGVCTPSAGQTCPPLTTQTCTTNYYFCQQPNNCNCTMAVTCTLVRTGRGCP